MIKTIMTRSALIALACALSVSAYAMADGAAKRPINIPSGELATALELLSKQSGTDLVYRPEQLRGLKTRGVIGELSTEQAVTQLLEGTPLTLSTDSTGAMLIAAPLLPAKAATDSPAPPSAPATGSEVKKNLWDKLRLSQAGNPQNSADIQITPDNPDSQTNDDLTSLNKSDQKVNEEVLVTGTNIRGTTNSASPVEIYTRDDIERTGLGSVAEFMLRLPENFKGGASEGIAATTLGGGKTDDQVGGTGVNLRGLGNDSTLVLIDGHRVAPANASGNYVDVSMIPLSAVERIEIVTDGASAIYGSDAVGGVVNFVMRHDFDGAETRARFGSVTQGDADETQVGQTLGKVWTSGSALLSYEYYDRSPLDARDRPYTQPVFQPPNAEFDLLPDQRRQSVFGTLNEQAPGGIDIFAEGNYSHRAMLAIRGSLVNDVDTTGYSGTLGARAHITKDYEVEVSSTYGHNYGSILEHPNTTSGPLYINRQPKTSVLSLDAKLDGSLWQSIAGPVRFAIGGQYRKESLEELDLLADSLYQPSRKIGAGFVELDIPLVGADENSKQGSRLELNVADRAEHYSDFGSTNNPKIGIVWRPSPDWKLRGTYGTSFKAPLLNDLNPVPFQTASLPEFDPKTDGSSNTFVVFGGNPGLKPEQARTWTLGFDFEPQWLQGLRVTTSYYNIHYTNQITDIQSAGVDVTDALRLADSLGPTIIQRNPPLSLLQSLADTSGFIDLCPGGCPLSTIAALIDSRSLNLSVVNTDGMDVGMAYTAGLPVGRLEVGVDGTYIFRLTNQFTAQTPVTAILNTQFNPVDLKLRGRIGYQLGRVNIATYINYVGPYDDTLEGISTPIGSWTTEDLNVAYRWTKGSGPFRDISTMLGVTNIANRNPPYVQIRPSVANTLFPALNYDGANANVLGRFLYLQVSARL